MAQKKQLPLSEVYGLLEPGPVVMVTTAGRGRPNIMTLSWHTMLDFEPPLVGCVISKRSRTFSVSWSQEKRSSSRRRCDSAKTRYFSTEKRVNIRPKGAKSS